MTQAIHLFILAALVVAIFYASLGLWLSAFTPSLSTKRKTLAIWVSLVVVFFIVLFNPHLVPGLLSAIPLPPNPFDIK